MGFSSLSDFLIANPNLNFFSAAKSLSTEARTYVAADIEYALRAECVRRDDLHFFARIALYTALTYFKPAGWGKQHYLLAGHWAGMMGEGSTELAVEAWRFLADLRLEEGWKPESIFDLVLKQVLDHAFGRNG